MNLEIPRTAGYQYLFSVAETFNIKGRGLVIASEPSSELSASLKTSFKVELNKPDGTWLSAQAHLEVICPNPKGIISISLPEMTKDDVPAGTKVWCPQDVVILARNVSSDRCD